MKIEKVISKCNDCPFYMEMQNIKSSRDNITICAFPNVVPFITSGAISNCKIKTKKEIEIPDNCPLEKFKKTYPTYK